MEEEEVDPEVHRVTENEHRHGHKDDRHKDKPSDEDSIFTETEEKKTEETKFENSKFEEPKTGGIKVGKGPLYPYMVLGKEAKQQGPQSTTTTTQSTTHWATCVYETHHRNHAPPHI